MARLLDRDELSQKGIKFSRGHLHRLIAAGVFPKPVKLGKNRNAWLENEIDAFIEAKVAERDADYGVKEATT
jgi:prophage regulatory protein